MENSELTIEKQLEVCCQVLNNLTVIQNKRNLYNATNDGGLCEHFKIALNSIDINIKGSDEIKVYIPLFKKPHKPENEFYWWNPRDLETRIIFVKDIIKQLVKKYQDSKNKVKTLTIEDPEEKAEFLIKEGYEIDLEKSNLKESLIILKKSKPGLPSRWEDIKQLDGFYISTFSTILKLSEKPLNCSKNTLPTKEIAEKMLVYNQLIYLRNIYWDGWIPNWTDNSYKFVIYNEGKILQSSNLCNVSRPFAFQSQEIRDLFLKNFKKQLEFIREFI